jgi:hypothetical protein
MRSIISRVSFSRGHNEVIDLRVRGQNLMEITLLMQLLLVVADAGLHQHLRDLVLQLDVLSDQQLAVTQGASSLPDLHRCHIALRQEVAAQAVGDLACIDAIVLLLRDGNRTQHQGMSHLHRCRMRSKVVVDPAREHRRFHRYRPRLGQRP